MTVWLFGKKGRAGAGVARAPALPFTFI